MKTLEWIIIRTTNYQKSKNFYKEMLRLHVERDIPDEEFTQFKLANCFLAIYGAKFFDTLTGTKKSVPPGSTIFTFAQVANVDAEVHTLKQKGVHFIKDPITQPWGQRTAYFTDPDGYIWELQQWTE